MDLSSVLPLLMNNGKAQNTDAGRLASMLGAMNGGALNGNSPLNSNLINLLNLANKNSRPKRPSGLKPIKDIVPNDILGILVKNLTKSL